MKIKILKYDLNASSYVGGHRKVQSYKRHKGKWKINKNWEYHKIACRTPYAFNVLEYFQEVKDNGN